MKRLLSLLLALLLCALLTACGDAKDSFESVRNSKTGDTISLGMSRKDAEELLGKGAPFDYEAFWKKVDAASTRKHEGERVGRTMSDPNHYTYGSAEEYISIYYENDSVVGFNTNAEEATSSNWVLLDDITHGSPLEDVVKSLGEVEKWPLMGPMPDGRTVYWLNYLFDANGKKIEDISSASLNIVVYMIEDTDSLLAFSVNTIDHTVEIDYLKSIFENRDRVHIFDEAGNELTEDFFRLHEENYAQGNLGAILDDLAERGLTVSH